jgi:hypothetical protein
MSQNLGKLRNNPKLGERLQLPLPHHKVVVSQVHTMLQDVPQWVREAQPHAMQATVHRLKLSATQNQTQRCSSVTGCSYLRMHCAHVQEDLALLPHLEVDPP